MKTLAGFHAVKGRLKQKADSVREIYVDAQRSDARMRELKAIAEKLGVRLTSSGVQTPSMGRRASMRAL